MEREVLSSDKEVKLTVKLLTESPKPGEAIWINLGIKNLGTNRLEWDASPFEMTVSKADSNQVQRTKFGTFVLTIKPNANKFAVMLQPGETENWKINLTRYFDLSESGTHLLTVQHSSRYGSSEKLMVKDFSIPVLDYPADMNGFRRRLIPKND